MKLLLTSEGFANQSIIRAFKKLVGKPVRTLHLAYIPTAANVEDEDKSWVIEDLTRCRNLGFGCIDIVDISALPKRIWYPRLEKADVFLFEGGNTSHLMYWLEKSGLQTVLPELLKTRVYVGISAGSMVATKNRSLTSENMLYYEKTGRFPATKGLGLVDFEIRPHLNSESFPKVRVDYLAGLAKDIPNTVYAIDDATAIQVIDKEVTVISEGVWKKFH